LVPLRAGPLRRVLALPPLVQRVRLLPGPLLQPAQRLLVRLVPRRVPQPVLPAPG